MPIKDNLPKGCDKCPDREDCVFLKWNDPQRCKKRREFRDDLPASDYVEPIKNKTPGRTYQPNGNIRRLPKLNGRDWTDKGEKKVKKSG